MVWRRLFNRNPNPPEDTGNQQDSPDPTNHSSSIDRNPQTAPNPVTPARRLPGHLAEQLAPRRARSGDRNDPTVRLQALSQRRRTILYDIEQGVMAREDDNPWKRRVDLLTEALQTIEDDRKQIEQIEPGPWHPLPQTPLTDLTVTFEREVATVRFHVGSERFTYEEPLDWAERGHQISRAELVRTEGDAASLVPSDTPAALQAALRRHLELSVFTFATELRERTLDNEPLPSGVVLADLARPCETCGGWTDFPGRCQQCAARAARLQQLVRERDRLLDEQAAEMEEQHRIAERLPVAQRRLADIDTEIAALEKRIRDG